MVHCVYELERGSGSGGISRHMDTGIWFAHSGSEAT